MSFWKDAGKSVIKYSEIVVQKTEEYTRIAKLILDIKKLENNIETRYCETGEYVMKKVDEGLDQVSLNDDLIRSRTEIIRDSRLSIESKRKEIADIKAARNTPHDKTTSTGGPRSGNAPR